MKQRHFMLPLLLILGMALPAVSGSDVGIDITGSWEGTLEFGGSKLRVIFNLAKSEEGKIGGTLDSPDQGAYGISISKVAWQKDGTLEISVDMVGGRFLGTLEKEGAGFDGEWSQGGMSLPLKLVRKGTPEPPVPGTGLDGTWEGTLEFSGMKLRTVFNIAGDGHGEWSGTVDSPDQAAYGLEMSEIAMSDDRSVSIAVATVQGRFEGTLNADASRLTGNWSQGGVSIPLDMARTEMARKRNRPQTPKPPLPYRSEEVQYENADAKITLAGTLTLPQAGGPFPAALLITGSGPQDRDETLFEHKPFFVLADALTRRGIAVLRVDDRGVGGSTGVTSASTSEDFAGDVRAGIRYLKSRKEIRSDRIGLIGHSEGGLVAPMVASRSKDVAFIVLMAGPGLTGAEILYLQGELIQRASGMSEEFIRANKKTQRGMFEAIRQGLPEEEERKKLREILLADPNVPGGDAAEPVIQGQIQTVCTPWFRFFLQYDPVPALRGVQCPVLAINGELDLQVPPKENLAAIGKALSDGGNHDFKLVELPKLNHLFQECETGSPARYGIIEETISPIALSTIGDWILERTGP